MEIDFSILDRLIDDDVAFAIYRLPTNQDIHLIIQNDNQVYKTNNYCTLTEKSGFVISPFQITDDCPIVIIRPDHHLVGAEEINCFSTNYSPKNRVKMPANFFDDSTSRQDYATMFERFQEGLKAGKFQKLVLSRKQNIELPPHFLFANVFSRALSTYPNTFVYLAHTSSTSTWLGSTPELFLSEKNGIFHSVALAGTQTVAPGTDISTLSWSDKNVYEQQIVADYFRKQLADSLLPFSNSDTYSFRVGNLAHLKTDFHFQRHGQITTGEILALIHPTPAVCGFPKQEALEFINKIENHSRSYYSGFVGNLGMNNRTDLYVNLRCLQVKDRSLSLYAGGGILSSSNKEEEWTETEDKMQAMFNILR
ncbi:MAG: isochorismate synthase [Bacteroidetes bacterium]|nr:isochorismate synthase [Bacteroidota bacterium]